MKKILGAAIVASVGVLLLAGCAPAQNQDRTGGEGSNPDFVYDTALVEIYRNADNIPNIAYFCAGDYGWASTLSNDGTSSPALVRLPEYDSKCSDLPAQTPVPTPEDTEAPE